MPRSKDRKSYFDEVSCSSGESSTISSFSQSTGSSWSLPRTHRNSNYRRSTADGPKRSGSSFRVALRPSRHRTSSSSSSGGTPNRSDASNCCCCFAYCCCGSSKSSNKSSRKRGGTDYFSASSNSSSSSSSSTKSLRRILCILMASAILGAVVHIIHPNHPLWDMAAASAGSHVSYLYEIYDKLSTEDLVAQGEMSSKADEDILSPKPPVSSTEAQDDESTTTTKATKRTVLGELEAGSKNVVQSFLKKKTPTIPPTPPKDPTTTMKESTTTSTTMMTTNNNDVATSNFYDTVYKNKKPFTAQDVLSTHSALRMMEDTNTSSSSTPSSDSEDDDDDDDDVNATTTIPNNKNFITKHLLGGNRTTNQQQQPIRKDWGPSRRPPQSTTSAPVVAYVLPVFTCYKLSSSSGAVNHYGFNEPSNDGEFHNAALMLQASVHKNSIRNNNRASSYDYEMVALIHRGIQTCAGGTNRTKLLQQLGYRVEVVREPIHKTDIKNEYLRNYAPRNNGGRAGMKEMIRLYAFKLIEYPLVVLVDTTTWILRPPDDIYNVMLKREGSRQWLQQQQQQEGGGKRHVVQDTFYPNGTIVSSQIMGTTPIPTTKPPPQQQQMTKNNNNKNNNMNHVIMIQPDLDIMFTRDYSTMRQGDWTTGISLAFTPIRPSIKLFNQLINTYQGTEYHEKYGWNRKGYVKYAGAMQTKGLLTYFFSEIRPDRKLELHRCMYNNLADVPYIAGRRGAKHSDQCRDVKEHKRLFDGRPMPCTDCRTQPWDDIVVANFGICQVPWVCPHVAMMNSQSVPPLLVPTVTMCRRFHESWFATRQAVELTAIPDAGKRTKNRGTFYPEIFRGYCMPGGGPRGGSYIPLLSTTNAFINGFGNKTFPSIEI